MLRDNVRSLLKHTSIYSLGWFANTFAAVILLPIYSRYLSREDYGAVDLVQQTNAIFKILCISSFTYSIGRFYHDAKNDAERALTLSTGAVAGMVAGAIVAVTCVVACKPLSNLIFGDAEHVDFIYVGAAMLFFDLTFIALSFQFLVTKKSLAFVLLNLAKLITGVVANLAFVVWYEMGAMGMLCGNLVSYIPICAMAFYMCGRAYGFKIDARLLNAMIRWGAPMVPAALLATVMHNGDRFLLRPLGSMEQVGLLSMGLMFPSMLNSVLLTSFNFVWGGATMFQVAKQEDAGFQIARITTYFMGVFVFFLTALGIVSPTLLEVLVDEKFLAAQTVIPIVCVGFSCHAFYTFLTMHVFTNGKTGIMIVAYAIPVCVKFGLSYLFVGRYGYVASAWIVTATYVTFAATCYLLFRRESRIPFEYGRLGVLAVSCLVALLVASSLRFDAAVVDGLAQGAIVLLLAISLWYGPFVNDSERLAVRQEVRIHWRRLIDRVETASSAQRTDPKANATLSVGIAASDGCDVDSKAAAISVEDDQFN